MTHLGEECFVTRGERRVRRAVEPRLLVIQRLVDDLVERRAVRLLRVGARELRLDHAAHDLARDLGPGEDVEASHVGTECTPRANDGASVDERAVSGTGARS